MLYIRGILLSKIFKLQGKIHQIQNLISIQVTALHEAMVLSFCKQSRFHKINQVFPSVGVVTYIQCVDSFWKIERRKSSIIFSKLNQ